MAQSESEPIFTIPPFVGCASPFDKLRASFTQPNTNTSPILPFSLSFSFSVTSVSPWSQVIHPVNPVEQKTPFPAFWARKGVYNSPQSTFSKKEFVYLIIGLIWLGLACTVNALRFLLKIYMKYSKNLPVLTKNQLCLSSLFSFIGLNLAFTKHTINV